MLTGVSCIQNNSFYLISHVNRRIFHVNSIISVVLLLIFNSSGPWIGVNLVYQALDLQIIDSFHVIIIDFMGIILIIIADLCLCLLIIRYRDTNFFIK